MNTEPGKARKDDGDGQTERGPVYNRKGQLIPPEIVERIEWHMREGSWLIGRVMADYLFTEEEAIDAIDSFGG